MVANNMKQIIIVLVLTFSIMGLSKSNKNTTETIGDCCLQEKHNDIFNIIKRILNSFVKMEKSGFKFVELKGARF
jgi:hypothetical protein